MLKKYLIGLSIICVCFFVSAGKAVSSEPTDQIKSTVDKILSIMENEEFADPSKKQERRKRIMEAVHQRFDFWEMSQRSLARHWKNISESEKERFKALFTNLLEDTYIGKVENYSGEKIVFEKEIVRGDKAIVNSAFIKNDIETPIIYRLQQENGKWMVYDVVIEGVSLVRNYRTQFDQILDKDNFDGLIRKLEEKVTKDKASE